MHIPGADAELCLRDRERRKQPAGHHGGQDGLAGGQAGQHSSLPRLAARSPLQVGAMGSGNLGQQKAYYNII